MENPSYYVSKAIKKLTEFFFEPNIPPDYSNFPGLEEKNVIICPPLIDLKDKYFCANHKCEVINLVPHLKKFGKFRLESFPEFQEIDENLNSS